MKKRPILISVLSFLAFIVLMIALLPTLVSTNGGKNLLLKMVSKETRIESLSLSWLGTQEIKGLSHGDFSCDEIKSDASLLRILFKQDFGNLTIVHPHGSFSETFSECKPTPQPKKAKSKKFVLPFSGHFVLQEGELSIKSAKFDPVDFQDLSLDLNIPKEYAPISFSAGGATHQGSIEGQFKMEGMLDPFKEELVFEGDLVHFPIRGLDQVVGLFYPCLNGVVTDAIGPSFDAKIDARILKEDPALNIKATSANFKADIQTIPQNGSLSLKQPALLSLTLTPDLIQKFAGFTPPKSSQVQIKVDQLNLPLKTPEKLAFNAVLDLSQMMLSPTFAISGLNAQVSSPNLTDNINFSAKASMQLDKTPAQMALAGNFKIDPLQGNAELSLNSNTLQIPKLNLSLSDNIITVEPATITYAPTQLTAQLQSAQIPLSEPQSLKAHLLVNTPKFLQFSDIAANVSIDSLQKIDLQVKEKQLSAETSLSLKNESVSLSKPLIIEGILTNAALPQLPLTIKPTPIKLRVDPFTLDLKEDLIAQTKVKADGFIQDLVLSTADGKQAAFGELKVQIQLDAKKEMAFLDLSSKGVDAQISVDKLIYGKEIDASQSTVSFNLDLQNFPSPVMETWLGDHYPLSAALGPTINLQVKGLSSPKAQNFSVAAASQNLNLQMALTVKDGMLTLQNQSQPGKIDFTLNKEGYKLINEMLDNTHGLFDLENQSVIKGTITLFRWPVLLNPNPVNLLDRLPTLQGNFADVRLQGKFTVDELALKEKKTERIADLHGLIFTFNKSGSKEPIAMHLESQVAARGSKSGQVSIDVKIENLFSEQGFLSTESMSANINATTQNFPTLLLDAFSPNAQLSKLFGATLNSSLSTQIQNRNGPVSLNIQAPNTRASLKGKLMEGVLLLSEPIYAQVTLTPGVSSYILSKANPLSLSEITSQNPLTLQVDPKGFMLPLFPFNMNMIMIPKARIELGQLSCKNEGNLNFTLGLLKSKQYTNDRTLKLWFAPLDIQMKNGILNVERTEVLVAETFDIALWGKIDLPKDYVDMVLGLTADCLQAAFGIKDLPRDYVLQIPMRGKMDKVEINKTMATAKIAALLAWQQKALEGLFGDSAAGGLFGELLNKLGPLPDFNSKPPPAKRPFPWETAENNREIQKRKNSNKSKIKPNEKPLKQLLKILR